MIRNMNRVAERREMKVAVATVADKMGELDKKRVECRDAVRDLLNRLDSDILLPEINHLLECAIQRAFFGKLTEAMLDQVSEYIVTDDIIHNIQSLNEEAKALYNETPEGMTLDNLDLIDQVVTSMYSHCVSSLRVAMRDMSRAATKSEFEDMSLLRHGIRSLERSLFYLIDKALSGSIIDEEIEMIMDAICFLANSVIQVDGYDAEEFLVLISEVATMNLFNLWFNNATCMRQE